MILARPAGFIAALEKSDPLADATWLLAPRKVEWLDPMDTLGEGDLLGGALDVLEARLELVPTAWDDEAPPVLPALGDDDFLLGKAIDLPLVLPPAGPTALPPIAVFDHSARTLQWIDHMISLGQDGFLPGRANDLDALLLTDFSGDAEPPPVLPAVSEDDFLLGKDADLPLVLPGADGFDPEGPVFSLPIQEPQWLDQGLTLGDDGFLPGPGGDVLLHYHDDGWLI